MPRKSEPQQDDPEEYKRFLETAKTVEAETDPKAFERAFKNITTRARPQDRSKKP